MKTKLIGITILAAILLAFSGCTENISAKSFGGKVRIEAPAGQTVVNMTWKEGDLWIQYKDRPKDQAPAVTTFKEHSNFGLLSGEVIVIEK